MTFEISRRATLGMLGGAIGASLASPLVRAAGTPARSLDLEDPAVLGKTFRKLAYSLDETLTFWWLRGTRYGVVDSVATPLWDMYVGTWLRTRDLEGGDYELTTAGANFYTAPGSDTLLESFENPYTGKTVPLTYRAPAARKTVVSAAGGSNFMPEPRPGMTIRSKREAGPGWVHGDEVIVRGDIFFYSEPLDPEAGPPAFNVNDWSTYIGSLSDVTDPAITNAPCRQQFNDILTWPPWLEMQGYPGMYYSQCYGRKAFRLDDMPSTWQRIFMQRFPEAAADPGAILDQA
jgi:hypothetical protein